MKAFAFAVVCLALAAGTSRADEADPCVDELKLCRDVICHGREVLQNECKQSQGTFMKACGCGGDLIESESELSMTQEVEQAQEDCDEEEDVADLMQAPRGFAFSFNFGGDRPQQQQMPRMYSYSTPLQSLFGDSDDGDDAFAFPSLGMLFNVMRARQQFLQNSPSYMTRRVYFPASGQTYRLVTRDELEEQERQRAVKEAVVERIQNAVRAREAGGASAQRAAQELAERVKATRQQEMPVPKPAVRLHKAPSSMPESQIMPEPLNVDDADAQRDFTRKRMLYCVASIALIMSVVALNASLFMCCASSREDREVDVEVVAATTPLLVEYEVQKVSSCKDYEVAPEFKPLPREGIKS